MQITPEHKEIIAEAIADDLKMRKQKNKDYLPADHARYLQIDSAIYSRITKGDRAKILSDVEWWRVAKRLFVDLSGRDWKIAKTKTVDFLTGQLLLSQEDSLCGIMCDLVGIGKTTGAEAYSRTHHNVVYIKCHRGISPVNLVKEIAQNLGVRTHGKAYDIRERLRLQILKLDKPLVILDDAGYMNTECYMEVKGLYDDTEYACAWYLIGDKTLKKKIVKLLEEDREGWEAFFDRFNRKFQALTDLPDYDTTAKAAAMQRIQAEQILQLNMPTVSKELAKEIFDRSGLSLRVLRKEIYKRKQIKKAA